MIMVWIVFRTDSLLYLSAKLQQERRDLMNIDTLILSELSDDTALTLTWLDELWHYERDDDCSFSGTVSEYRLWREHHPMWNNAPVVECEITRGDGHFTCSFIHCLDE